MRGNGADVCARGQSSGADEGGQVLEQRQGQRMFEQVVGLDLDDVVEQTGQRDLGPRRAKVVHRLADTGERVELGVIEDAHGSIRRHRMRPTGAPHDPEAGSLARPLPGAGAAAYGTKPPAARRSLGLPRRRRRAIAEARQPDRGATADHHHQCRCVSAPRPPDDAMPA